jgi:DNA-binding protein WhiA
MARVGMTAAVKDELARLPVVGSSARRAELSALLRFAGGLHLVAGRVVVEAELDTSSVVRRVCRGLAELFGAVSDVQVVAGGVGRGPRYVVRVTEDGESLARRAGLLDGAGRPVRGLAPALVSGPLGEVAAAWRGAFLAQGSVTEPGRSCALELTSPGPEAALALAGAARRLGVGAKVREVRGSDRVVVRGSDAISGLLARMGAHDSHLQWEQSRVRPEARVRTHRRATFDDANARRSARAAVAAGARVTRALQLLADLDPPLPDHLLHAGRLRLEHPTASLEELGALADPPMTKDAVAGRLRRLLALADQHATDLGVPGTGDAVTPDMLAQ